MNDHPNYAKAHSAVCYALKTGRLIRQPCRVCGSKRSDAHHDDYDRPLDVLWFCRRHHFAHHKTLGWGEPGREPMNDGKGHCTVNMSVRVSEEHLRKFRERIPPAERRRFIEAQIERDYGPI